MLHIGYLSLSNDCQRKTAMQCCGSGMFIPDPDFYPTRVPDLGSKNSSKREGWKKDFCHTFFCSHKFHIIENYFIFEKLKKKIRANFIFKRIIELFTQKIVTKLSKIWVWDPGSEIRKKPILDPGSRIPDPGVKKAPDPQHCCNAPKASQTLSVHSCSVYR